MKKKEWWEKIFDDRHMPEILFGNFAGSERSYHTKATRDEVGFVLKRTGARPPAKVLDICCGIGRHSIELAGEGYDVTGVDLTRQFLTLAKGQAKKEGLDIRFIRKAMDDLKDFQGKFDLVVNLFTSFGYYYSRKKNESILKGMVSTVRPGGHFVIDINNLGNAINQFQQKDWHSLGDGFLLEQRELSKNKDKIKTDWIYLKKNLIKKYQFFLHLYTSGELKKMLKRAGLKDIRFFGSFEGKRVSAKSRRLIAVGRK